MKRIYDWKMQKNVLKCVTRIRKSGRCIEVTESLGWTLYLSDLAMIIDEWLWD